MSDARVRIVITAEGANAKAAIEDVKNKLGEVGGAGQQAGAAASEGLNLIAAASTRLTQLLGAVGVAGALMGVARAGDEMTASLGRLQAATGSIQSAAETYNQLYRISLQTGVAVAESAGAFARFAIAARQIGATRDEVTQLVRTIQQAGAIGGASTAETAAATQQLGQALASGRLQGDELRSILENMPNLAEALARQLGVGIGELRKMGEEGRLTAQVVFPALLRASEEINRQFTQMPVTMERAFGQLGIATRRFLADLDQAVGLSRAIAAAAQSAANALDRTRRANLGTPTEQAEELVARRGEVVRQGERTVSNIQAQLEPGGPDRPTRNLVGQERIVAQRELARQQQQLEQARRDLQAAQRQLDFAQGEEAGSRAIGSSGEAAIGRFAARDAAQTRVRELQEQIDPRIRIRREAEQRRQQTRDDGALAGTERAEIERMIREINAEERRDVQAVDRREAGPKPPEDRRPERLRNSISVLEASTEAELRNARAIEQGGLAARQAEADQKALIEATRLYPQGGAEFQRALEDLTQRHRALSAAQAEGRAAQLAFNDSQAAAEQALQSRLIGSSALTRARETAIFQRRRELDRQGIDPESERGRGLIANAASMAEQRVELERNQAAYQEIGRIGEQAFDRIGQAVTSGTLTLKSFGDIGKSVISELMQAFLRLAIINPIKNSLFGDNKSLPGEVFGAGIKLLGGFFGGGDPSLGSNIAAKGTPITTYGVGDAPIGSLYHKGGIVGLEPTAIRAVNDNLFRHAPRFHQGGHIGADEVPAILQRGEGVFTPEQMARLGPAGGQAVTINMPIQFSGDSGSEADRAGLLALVDARVRAGVASMMPEIARGSHQYTLSEVSRGGSAARALGRR